jgi:hypothetical protein
MLKRIQSRRQTTKPQKTLKMKTQQTTTTRQLPSAFKPFKYALILGTAVLLPATCAFSEEIAAWTFATDSGKPASSGAPVVSAESTPANEWPLKLTPKDMDSPLVYKESIFDSASKYQLMVEFANVKPDLRGYLHNADFNGLIGKKSWRIDMEVSLESHAPAILMELGGGERGAISIWKQFKGGLRIAQIGYFDSKAEGVILEPKKPYKISLIKDGKMLSMEINGEPHELSSGAVAITSPGICVGGPANASYGTPVGSISAIRIQSTEAAE